MLFRPRGPAPLVDQLQDQGPGESLGVRTNPEDGVSGRCLVSATNGRTETGGVVVSRSADQHETTDHPGGLSGFKENVLRLLEYFCRQRHRRRGRTVVAAAFFNASSTSSVRM